MWHFIISSSLLPSPLHLCTPLVVSLHSFPYSFLLHLCPCTAVTPYQEVTECSLSIAQSRSEGLSDTFLFQGALVIPWSLLIFSFLCLRVEAMAIGLGGCEGGGGVSFVVVVPCQTDLIITSARCKCDTGNVVLLMRKQTSEFVLGSVRVSVFLFVGFRQNLDSWPQSVSARHNMRQGWIEI